MSTENLKTNQFIRKEINEIAGGLEINKRCTLKHANSQTKEEQE